jgi:hypothetical protein
MNKGKAIISTLVISALLMFFSCTEKAISTTIQADDIPENEYTDDLSKYRPIIGAEEIASRSEEVIKNEPILSRYDMTPQFDNALDSIASRNRKVAILKGYTILVYSGINELDAGRVRNRLFDILPEMQAVLQYKLPTYYVKVGRFYQQIEAQPLYEKIKKYYPNATVVPEQFKLEK